MRKLKPIPKDGIRGEQALREAAAQEFRTVMNLVRQALAEQLYPSQPEAYVSIEAIYPDRVIVENDGRYISYPYTIDASNKVQLGKPTEVVEEYIPVAQMTEAQGQFLEAQDNEGLKWRIRVIKAGLSGNRNFYPDAVLREAADLFNGVRVFVKPDEEHLKGQGKSFRNLIGRLSNSTFVEGGGSDQGSIEADLELLASADGVPAKMLEAYQRGMAKDLFGFSVDAAGKAKIQRDRRIAQSISKVNSVDLIIEPGAGGQIINLLEAQDPEVAADMALRTRMIEAVKKANGGSLPDGLDVDDEEALETAYREALKPNTPEAKPQQDGGAGNGAGSAQAEGISREELDQTVRMVEARANMRVTIAESNLPDIAKQRLRNHFDGLADFKEADVSDAIKAEREYIANFRESGKVQGLGGEMRIEAGESRAEKIEKMLDAFWDPNNRDVTSFKECYIAITGDKRITGQLRDVDQALFRESLSDAGNLDVVLGDAIHRAMIRDYNNAGQYDIWQQLVSVTSLNDFRTNHRTRLGGYGDLPTVAKSAAYAALTSPGDEEATYAPTKRGGTETIALEDIRNDDVGLIQRIPTRLSRAAKRTLAKFVLDFIATNPTIYDGNNLFTAGHGNLGSSALDATTLAAGRLAMLDQTELGSGERIGIGPKNLIVPFDLQETAVNLFNRNTNLDTTFIQKLSLNVIPVWYWTDANDWALSADPMDIPTIEIGFLDGQQEPDLFVQDNPTSGSMFSNDQLTWKIRHIYGGAVVDYRGLYKAVVA